MSELRECPFCGNGEQMFLERNQAPFNMHYIACPGCNSDGPLGSTEAEATRLWNTRPREAALEEALGVAVDKLESLYLCESDGGRLNHSLKEWLLRARALLKDRT